MTFTLVVPYVPSILGQLLDLINLARINLTKFGFSFSVKLCPKNKPYAYSDGDKCCGVNKELEDGGHSGEFA